MNNYSHTHYSLIVGKEVINRDILLQFPIVVRVKLRYLRGFLDLDFNYVVS
jgi:hypothetical protein